MAAPGWRRPASAPPRSRPARQAPVRSILQAGLDRAFLEKPEQRDHQPLRHGNIRGQGCFH